MRGFAFAAPVHQRVMLSVFSTIRVCPSDAHAARYGLILVWGLPGDTLFIGRFSPWCTVSVRYDLFSAYYGALFRHAPLFQHAKVSSLHATDYSPHAILSACPLHINPSAIVRIIADSFPALKKQDFFPLERIYFPYRAKSLFL